MIKNIIFCFKTNIYNYYNYDNYDNSTQSWECNVKLSVMSRFLAIWLQTCLSSQAKNRHKVCEGKFLFFFQYLDMLIVMEMLYFFLIFEI